MVHLHEVRDSDKHFVIDPVTMVITNNSAKTTIRQGDHNSEIYTFEIPLIVEGHDMSLCNRVEIHYNNDSADKAESSNDYYLVNDLHVDAYVRDTLCFSWLIHGNATKFDGKLSFRIRFGCVDNEGKYTYKKHTETYDGITVSPGRDNTAADIEEYSDVLYGLISEVQQMKETLLDGFSTTTIKEITLPAADWAGQAGEAGIVGPYMQTVDIEGLTEYSKVDLLPSAEQFEIFRDNELAFVTENNEGVLCVYAIGEKPQETYTIQVAITEVKL